MTLVKLLVGLSCFPEKFQSCTFSVLHLESDNFQEALVTLKGKVYLEAFGMRGVFNITGLIIAKRSG
jgi:hypothetical protein